MEICPFCFRQLITCGCAWAKLGIADVDRDLTEEEEDEWDQILHDHRKIPYVHENVWCARCGTPNDLIFMIFNEQEWSYYVGRDLLLCSKCYKRILELGEEFDTACPGIRHWG